MGQTRSNATKEQAADLHARQQPQWRVSGDDMTVKELGNEFLTYQMERVRAGQIGGRWFEDCRRVIVHFARRMGRDRSATAVRAVDFQAYRRVLGTEG